MKESAESGRRPEDQCLVSYPTQPCVACSSQVCLPCFCPDGRTQAGAEAFCSDFPYETWKEKYRCFGGEGGNLSTYEETLPLVMHSPW